MTASILLCYGAEHLQLYDSSGRKLGSHQIDIGLWVFSHFEIVLKPGQDCVEPDSSRGIQSVSWSHGSGNKLAVVVAEDGDADSDDSAEDDQSSDQTTKHSIAILSLSTECPTEEQMAMLVALDNKLQAVHILDIGDGEDSDADILSSHNIRRCDMMAYTKVTTHCLHVLC